MKTPLTPYYLDLVYDACLKSFWRRKALARFLQQCSVSGRFLSTWSKDESKRDLLDRLFPVLPKNEKGRGCLLKMAKLLMEQRSFPDLENWEDSEEKIKQAHEAVGRLRAYHARQEEKIRSAQSRQQAHEAFRKRQEEVSRSQQSLQRLHDQLTDLGQKLGSQAAGYEFQRWFFDLLDFSEVENRRPYQHGGRQIDGSLTVQGTTYLVELKFTSGQAGATEVDSLYKKVVTKADNTMGVLVSISGFSPVATKEASGDRTPLLLLDHSHLYLVLGGMMSMTEVVERVRRHASQTGEAYLAVERFSSG